MGEAREKVVEGGWGSGDGWWWFQGWTHEAPAQPYSADRIERIMETVLDQGKRRVRRSLQSLKDR